MRFNNRSTQWYAAATFLLLAGSIAATKAVAPECAAVAARAWVAAHPDALPTSLAQVTQFPAPYQLVILRSLPANTQAQIWRDHFAATSRRVGLNDEQRRILKLVDDSLDSWVAAKVPPATLGSSGEIYKLIRRTFSDSLARVFFVSLGGSGRGTMAIQTASMLSAANSLFSLATVQAGIRAVFGPGSIAKALAPVPPCDCSTESDWCTSGANCRGWMDCDINWGCGTLGFYPCNGLCAF